jgi:hypothetical protein
MVGCGQMRCWARLSWSLVMLCLTAVGVKVQAQPARGQQPDDQLLDRAADGGDAEHQLEPQRRQPVRIGKRRDDPAEKVGQGGVRQGRSLQPVVGTSSMRGEGAPVARAQMCDSKRCQQSVSTAASLRNAPHRVATTGIAAELWKRTVEPGRTEACEVAALASHGRVHRLAHGDLISRQYA